jgi:hypothetical protein
MKQKLQLVSNQLPQTMDLKYCERCGNLWLRRSGSHGTTCAPCSGAEAELANGTASFLQLWSRLRAEAQTTEVQL